MTVDRALASVLPPALMLHRPHLIPCLCAVPCGHRMQDQPPQQEISGARLAACWEWDAQKPLTACLSAAPVLHSMQN